MIIEDNGPGIEDTRKETLFEKDRRYGGIGHHQVKQIVEKYRGSIVVMYRISGSHRKRTKFVVCIPKTYANKDTKESTIIENNDC